jgi:TolB-like protein
VLWSANYDESLAHVFLLQNNLITQIAGALAIRVKEV